MRIFAIKLGYIHNWDDESKAKLPLLMAARKAILDKIGINYAHHSESALRSAPEFVVSDDQLMSLMLEKQEPEIISEVGIGTDKLHRTVERLDAILAKAAQMFESNSRESSFNEKVEVHVPGAALMMVNSTMLMEDSCSDELQDALDKGWRIIAACPQPNSRRPDYILGRYDPAHEVGSSAKRKNNLQHQTPSIPMDQFIEPRTIPLDDFPL